MGAIQSGQPKKNEHYNKQYNQASRDFGWTENLQQASQDATYGARNRESLRS
jgi:hypothetical protein